MRRPVRWRQLALAAVMFTGGAIAFLPQPVSAEAGLQLNPLKYEDTLTDGRVKSGYIDVSNPGDATVSVVTTVEGFRQADLDGNLAFFADEALRAGIKPGLEHFELGPRESIRVAFSVEPAKLPRGGVYAAIFFRTVPPTPQVNVSYVAESANVGTLLILQNGAAGEQTGAVSEFDLPFWQFGAGLKGRLEYHNTNRNTGGLAFRPALESRVLPWGRPARFEGSFVMPQSTRQFTFVHSGSYLGLLPVTLTDVASGRPVTRWVVACTGWYRYLVPVAAIGLIWFLTRGRRSRVVGWLKRRLRRRQPATKRPLDGLSR